MRVVPFSRPAISLEFRCVLSATLFVALLSGCTHMGGVADADAVTAGAEARFPAVSWDRATMLRGDFDCDGRTDFAIAGTTRDSFHVAVVLGPPDPQSTVFEASFRYEGGDQDDLCGRPARMEIDSLEDPSDGLGAVPEGYAVSPECNGLRVTSGECDAFHLFWNHTTHAIDWWRL